MSRNPQAKFVPIDEQTNHNIVHVNRLGKTDRLACQPFDPRAERQVLPLNLLRVAITREALPHKSPCLGLTIAKLPYAATCPQLDRNRLF